MEKEVYISSAYKTERNGQPTFEITLTLDKFYPRTPWKTLRTNTATCLLTSRSKVKQTFPGEGATPTTLLSEDCLPCTFKRECNVYHRT